MPKRFATLLSLAVLGASSGAVFLLRLPGEEKPAPDPNAQAAGEKPAARETTEAPKTYPALEEGKGALEGKVVFKGAVPHLPPLEVPAANKDHAACAPHVKNERLILSQDNEVKDAVVAVSGYKPAEKPKPREITLDNKLCTFVPHTQGATAGSTIKLTNSDGFLHNTHALFAASFNIAVPAGVPVVQKLPRSGLVVMTCDIHAWMRANIQVFDHDLFDVTDRSGAFRIVNIPPGEYDIEVWHEFLAPAFKQKDKKIAGKVKIEAGKAARLDIVLEPPPK